MKLYLASKSPRRREILDLMRLDYDIVTAEADESLPVGIGMEAAGTLLAERKAKAAADLLADGETDGEEILVLAADTLVYLDGAPLGKPKDADDALRMLTLLSGRRHYVCTGVCLCADGKTRTAVDVTAVHMRSFTEAEIRAYIATGEPLDKAGAYGIQGVGSVLVEKIEGDFFSVMGLPPRLVRGLLADAGFSYFDLITVD